MIKFVGNEFDCRRKQIMDCFGEKFESALCNNACDNCIRNQHRYIILKDVSREAAVMVNLLQQILPNDISLNQLAEVYCGSRSREITEEKYHLLRGYGHGSKDQKTIEVDVDRLIRELLIEGAFEASIAIKAGNHFIAGLVLGAGQMMF